MATIKELIPIDSTSVSGIPVESWEIEFLVGAAAQNPTGVAVADHCLVCDGTKNISGLNNIAVDNVISALSLTDGTAIITGGVAYNLTLNTPSFTNPIITGTVTGSAIDNVTLTGTAGKLATSEVILDAIENQTGLTYDDPTITGTLTLNQDILAGSGIQKTTITDTDNKIPTSGAVVDYVAANATGELYFAEYTASSTQTMGEKTSGIPSNIVELTFVFSLVSTSDGSGQIQIQLGNSGGYATSCSGRVWEYNDNNSQTDIPWGGSGPAGVVTVAENNNQDYGIAQFRKVSTGWVCNSQIIALNSGFRQWQSNGLIELTGTLDRYKITCTQGVFNNGIVAVYAKTGS